MVAGAQAQASDQPSQRRGLRYCVQAPMDVTVLRSGVPDTVPGRSENLSSRGVAAVLAAELRPGESVGIEIHLPQAATPRRPGRGCGITTSYAAGWSLSGFPRRNRRKSAGGPRK